MKPSSPTFQAHPRHCGEGSALCYPTKQSLLFLGRAIRRGGLPGLFLLLFFVTIANAAHLAHLDIIWRTPANAAIQSHIESTINVSRGVNISESRLTSLIEATVAVLADHGHHHATIAPRDFRAADDSLSFTLEIDPGPSTRIIKWELLGLARTDSAWLADALSLPTGLTASASVIKDATSRLLSFTNIQLAGPPEVVTTGDDSCVIIQLHLREQTPARFEGALAAGSSEGEEQSLLGRFSLGLNGLFRRGHAIDIQYEHPQPRERLLRLNYSERHALWCNLTSRAQFEDWRRHDHRQRIRTDFSIGPRGHQSLALLLGVNWQKVSPLASTTETSRVYESSAGLSWRRGDVLDLSMTSTYSLHRQWETQSGADNSQSRVRIDSEGRATDLASEAHTWVGKAR